MKVSDGKTNLVSASNSAREETLSNDILPLEIKAAFRQNAVYVHTTMTICHLVVISLTNLAGFIFTSTKNVIIINAAPSFAPLTANLFKYSVEMISSGGHFL